MIQELKKLNEFKSLIKTGDVLLDFSAIWCGPCQMMKPNLEKLSTNYPKLSIITIDVDAFNELAAEYRIASVPTLVFYRNGEYKKTSIGYLPYQQLEKLIK